MPMLDELKKINELPPWETRRALRELIERIENEPKKVPRTLSQNRALHLNFDILAEKLNAAGYDQRKVLKPTVDIPWTHQAVKEQLWKPIMHSLYGHDSTTELSIGNEITHIHDVLMRHLGEKFSIEYHAFPSEEGKVGDSTQTNV